MVSVSTFGFPPFVRTDHSISVHGSSRMEVPRHSNRVGADHPRTPPTISAVATSWTAVRQPVQRTCRREEFVPHCDEEMQEWIEGRQIDLQAAILAGQFPEVVQGSARVATDHRRAGSRDAVCSGEHGEVIRVGWESQPGSRTESSTSTGQLSDEVVWGRQFICCR